MRVYDVAVIGGGPAGAAAALGASRAGSSVALFEPQLESDKPCGEGILPSGVAALQELGLDELLTRGRPIPRIRYVLSSGRRLEIPFSVPGRALPRHLLSSALGRALRAEPRIEWHERRVHGERTLDGLRLTGGGEAWTARTLIVADGLQGTAAPWLRRPRADRGRFGLRARAQARVPLDRVEVHLGRTSEVYLTPLPADLVNVAVLRHALPRNERSPQAWLAAALEEHPRAASLLGQWVTPPQARALSRARPRSVAEGGVFLAGDAAGGVDPVLGCGVAIGLTTGLAAARASTQVLAGERGSPERAYARFVRSETRLRRAVAGALTHLGGHPRLQEATAWLLGGWPALAARLAGRVAGT